MMTGGCHCGAIRYEVSGDVIGHSLCHCVDCRRSSGAPMVGWAMVPDTQLRVTGETSIYASSENGRRHFCIQCGTGLFYSNDAMLPGLVDITSATLDEPEKLAPEDHIQVADRIEWMTTVHTLPEHERFPPQPE